MTSLARRSVNNRALGSAFSPRYLLTGLLAIAAVAMLVGGSFIGLFLFAGDVPFVEELTRPYNLSIVRFTLWQSFLSTALSIGLAIPFALALYHRQRFPGRQLLLRLTSVSLVVPTMVAILGVIAVHGRQGWINDVLILFGFDRIDYLYGLNGILIAHVFFNLPLVTRLYLNGLNQIPDAQWKLARLYGFNNRAAFRLLEWPVLKSLVPGAAGIVFLLCFTSFAIVLSLGGGPGSTTLEVAIYQAVRFDFDLGKAVALSLIQIILCLSLALVFFSTRTSLELQASDGVSGKYGLIFRSGGSAMDYTVILVIALFLLSPFAGAFVRALFGGGWEILLRAEFRSALFSTLLISLSAGLLGTLTALAIATTIAKIRIHSRTPWLGAVPEVIGMLTLLLPPITLGTGLFLLVRTFTDALSLGFIMVILVNGLMTLAFALRILAAPVEDLCRRFSRLNQSLGLFGVAAWRLVTWPVVRKPLCYALAVSTTLSAGDMGVIALFGTNDLSTLPLLIYRLLGNYKMGEAAVVALSLCLLCFILFTAIEGLARNWSTNNA